MLHHLIADPEIKVALVPVTLTFCPYPGECLNFLLTFQFLDLFIVFEIRKQIVI
jgi:hypothetical protein